MTTRKILISNQYKALSKKVDNLIDKINILPNIDDYSFTDIIFMFNIYFIDCDKNNYQEKINNLLNIGSIELTDEEKNLVFQLIYEFVLWYKNLEIGRAHV